MCGFKFLFYFAFLLLGGSDWLAMAQQAQLLASLGGAVPSPMLSQMYGSNSLSGSGGTSGESSKAGLYNVKADHSRSTRSPGQGKMVFIFISKNKTRTVFIILQTLSVSTTFMLLDFLTALDIFEVMQNVYFRLKSIITSQQ